MEPRGEDLPAARRPAAADASGLEHMTWNVIASWGGHAVFVIAGFLMPRFIDRRIGQEALGVWDFAWSLVSYFGLAEIGVGSSVGRYVARHRAAGDAAGVQRVASSAARVQTSAALVAAALTVAVSLSVPRLFGDKLGVHAGEAAVVVALLGLALALQLGFDVFHGVMIGCHRWDLHNTINAGFHAVTVTAMITTVSLRGGLRGLAAAYFCGVLATEITRRAVAYRVCPELRIRWGAASWPQVRSMVAFGLKGSLASVSRLLLFQGVSLVVAGQLGAAALALYARPNALLRHAEALVNKFAHVLTPTASSLQATGHDEELRELLATATRLGMALALPMMLFLGVLGDPLLRLWMGARYEQGLVLGILAIGFLLPLSQQPAVTILTGLNLHGRVGLATLLSALAGVTLSLVTVGNLGWGLPGAALAVAAALTAGNGIFVPIYACRRLGLPVVDYARRAYLLPILCALPYAACLIATRRLLDDRHPLVAIVCGLAATAMLPPLYWRYLLPGRVREQVLGLLGRLRASLPAVGPGARERA